MNTITRWEQVKQKFVDYYKTAKENKHKKHPKGAITTPFNTHEVPCGTPTLVMQGRRNRSGWSGSNRTNILLRRHFIKMAAKTNIGKAKDFEG